MFGSCLVETCHDRLVRYTVLLLTSTTVEESFPYEEKDQILRYRTGREPCGTCCTGTPGTGDYWGEQCVSVRHALFSSITRVSSIFLTKGLSVRLPY